MNRPLRAVHILPPALLASLLLAACAGRPDYRPKGPGESVGYSDRPMTMTRYRVSFAGSAAMPLAKVKGYVLRRAAELALAAGYSGFHVAHMSTVAETSRHVVYPDAWSVDYGAVRIARNGSPWPDDAWVGPGTETRYTVSLEIVMLKDGQADGRPLVLSARDIIGGERIVLTLQNDSRPDP